MSILDRVAVAAGLAVRAVDPVGGPTPAGVMPPLRSSAPQTVTPREALGLDAVFRAVQILETAALQLTLDVWRGPVKIATPSVVSKPDLSDTGASFWASTVACLALRGNCYWRKTRGSDGSVINLEILDPLEVRPYLDERGRKRWAWHDQPELTDRDISHLRLLREPGQLLGLGPLQAAAPRVRGHLDVADYGSNWFAAGEVPDGVLSTDQNLTPAQATEWAEQWKKTRAEHRTAILGNGLSYAHLSLKPAEVQWLESQRFSIQSIARLFGIPARHLLVAVDGSSMTYQNAEQEDIEFVRWTLMAYLREIETAMSDLLPRGQSARFNVDALLRTDTKTRYEAHQIGLAAGFLTVAEVRAIEGLPVTSTATQEVPA